MTFEADLKAHLTVAGITAIVGDRITPQPVPEGSTQPAITYLVAGDELQTDLDGGDGELNKLRVQVDCWASTPDAVKALAELVRIRMKTAATSFKSVPLSAIEDYEPSTKRHRMSRDFSCWYRIS